MNASLDPTTEETSGRLLPSGRSLVLQFADGMEELEIRSPQGEMEVRITFTDSGPVVCLRGARLEMEAADTVSLRCRRLEVATTEETSLNSAGGVHITGQELRVRTEEDIHLDAAVIRLNCSEQETGARSQEAGHQCHSLTPDTQAR